MCWSDITFLLYRIELETSHLEKGDTPFFVLCDFTFKVNSKKISLAVVLWLENKFSRVSAGCGLI